MASLLVRPGTSDAKAIQEVWERNTYEKPRLGFVIEPGELWLDAGANVGAFGALVVARGGQVRCIEPNADNAALVRRNVLQAEVVESALTLAGGPVTLHTNTAPLALRRHSICRARRKSSPVVVRGVSWGDAIAACVGAKLNIEGAEIDLLSSNPPLGTLQKLVFEWSFDVCNEVNRLRRVVRWLEGEFSNVRVSRKLVGDVWQWYPPNCFVWGWTRVKQATP